MSDFKKKLGAPAKKLRSAVSSASERTAHVRRVARLNVEISGERDSIKRAYTEIGKLYYETHKDAPEGYFIRLCQDIDRSMTAISAMEAEIMQLKTSRPPAAETTAEK